MIEDPKDQQQVDSDADGSSQEQGDPGDIGSDLMFKNRDPADQEFRIPDSAPQEPGDPGDIGVEQVREGDQGGDDG